MGEECFWDGTLLEELAREFFQATQGISGDRPLALTWASICSGSEIILFVLLAISSAYKEAGLSIEFTHVFSCESNPAKRVWIRKVFEEVGVAEGCMFKRAEDMGGATAWCEVHKKRCPIPGADIMVAGTSCKDLSKANKNRNPKAFQQSSTPGNSANTFHGLADWLMAHAVTMLFFENVDAMAEIVNLAIQDDLASGFDKGNMSNLEIAMERFAEAGLSSLPILTDAQLFGLPQARRRYYTVSLKTQSSRLVVAVMMMVIMIAADDGDDDYHDDGDGEDDNDNDRDNNDDDDDDDDDGDGYGVDDGESHLHQVLGLARAADGRCFR